MGDAMTMTAAEVEAKSVKSDCVSFMIVIYVMMMLMKTHAMYVVVGWDDDDDGDGRLEMVMKGRIEQKRKSDRNTKLGTGLK